MRTRQKYFAGIVVVITMLVIFNYPALASPIELSLNDCIALAKQNNQVIKIAAFDRKKSLAMLNQAQASKGLSLTFDRSDKRFETYNLHQLYVNGLRE